MSTVFRATRHGPSVKLAAGEVALLRALLTALSAMLAIGEESEDDEESVANDPLEELTGLDESAAPVKPTDPALVRLLPDAYADDPERSAEFRRYTEPELRAQKRATIDVVLASLPPAGGRVVLTEAQADAWMFALNDLRLTLGTRLDVTEESYAELESIDPSTERGRDLTLYAWLGVLQETLVGTLS